MTDEEKAEEYAKGKAHEHYHFLFEENSGSPIDFAKLCYLDGLAEGKPKWHNLRKNQNDLPKETGHYLTDDGEVYIYDADCRKWRTLMCMACWDFDWLDDGDILAWCEIPKFEE